MELVLLLTFYYGIYSGNHGSKNVFIPDYSDFEPICEKLAFFVLCLPK